MKLHITTWNHMEQYETLEQYGTIWNLNAFKLLY